LKSNSNRNMTRFFLPWFITQFFTWLALFAMWIYTTPFLIERFFPVSIYEDKIDYGKALKWVGYCFALYSLLAAILAFLLPRLTKKYSIPRIHSVALFFGSLGFLALFFVHHIYTLMLAFTFIGIAWSSISNLPYQAVSKKSPEAKMHLWMNVFNFSVVIPQVTAAFLLNWLTAGPFHNRTEFTILAGFYSMLLASVVCWFWVRDNDI
jgi:MFS family permease